MNRMRWLISIWDRFSIGCCLTRPFAARNSRKKCHSTEQVLKRADSAGRQAAELTGGAECLTVDGLHEGPGLSSLLYIKRDVAVPFSQRYDIVSDVFSDASTGVAAPAVSHEHLADPVLRFSGRHTGRNLSCFGTN